VLIEGFYFMNQFLVTTAGLAVLFSTSLTFAQDYPPDNEARPEPPRGPMGSLLIKALDSDGDGTVSESEITNAPAVLKTLDQNKDGKLDEIEVRPNLGPGGSMRGGPGMRGGPDGGRGGNVMSADEEVQRYMTLDKNGDNQLSREEVPARMQGLFSRADRNSDGVITREEIETMAKKRFATMQQHGGSSGGFPGPPRD
jgi:Ca2+-binding EF-hand superfamily protein